MIQRMTEWHTAGPRGDIRFHEFAGPRCPEGESYGVLSGKHLHGPTYRQLRPLFTPGLDCIPRPRALYPARIARLLRVRSRLGSIWVVSRDLTSCYLSIWPTRRLKTRFVRLFGAKGDWEEFRECDLIVTKDYRFSGLAMRFGSVIGRGPGMVVITDTRLVPISLWLDDDYIPWSMSPEREELERNESLRAARRMQVG